MNNRFFALAEAFVTVARHRSITEAAAELGTSKSSISQKVSELEALLDVTLLRRTTRKITLTPAGARVFESCLGAVDATEKAAVAIGMVADRAGVPSGSVTLSGSNSYLTRIIMPKLAGFLADYPDIKPILIGSDRRVDFAAENIDLGIRIGPVHTDKYRTKTLAPLKRILVASPELMKTHGELRHPEGLADVPCVLREQEKPEWNMLCGGQAYCHRISTANLVVNTIELSHEAVKRGLGVALLADVIVREDVERGALAQVLPEWAFADIPVTLVSRVSRLGKPAVRMFYQHLVSEHGEAS